MYEKSSAGMIGAKLTRALLTEGAIGGHPIDELELKTKLLHHRCTMEVGEG